MSAQGNLNIHLTSKRRQQQAVIKVKESKEFMEVMENLTDLCFNNTDKMEEGLYIELQNTFMELFNLSLMTDIVIQSGKKMRNQNKQRFTIEQKRQAFANGCPYMTMCNNCSRIINKSFMKEHLASNVCKDNQKIIAAAGKDGINDMFNNDVLDKYVVGGGSDGSNQSS